MVTFSGQFAITGSHTLNNVTFDAANVNYTIASGTTLTVNGTLTVSGAANAALNTGNIHAKGDVSFLNGGGSNGGTATLTLNGAGTQTLTGSGTAGQGYLPNVVIDKSGGSTGKGSNAESNFLASSNSPPTGNASPDALYCTSISSNL